MRQRPTRPSKQATIVVFSQVYVPDPASVGQYLAEVGAELVRRGHRVIVYTANRGYDNSDIRYRSRETVAGVEVRRLRFSSFGKATTVHRIAGAASFLIQCFLAAILVRDLSGIVVSTVPPMIAVVAVLAGRIRGIPVAYWVMDLNPDQLIALGRLRANGASARILEAMNRFALRNSRVVIALDRFMATRLAAKAEIGGRLAVIPPWPDQERLDAVLHVHNPFRVANGISDKFVVMYSGNHTTSNPLTTLLDAAVRLSSDDRLRFLFIGGGVGKIEIEAYVALHRLANVISLPYQPLDQLRYSLSAADVHVVSLGDPMVGIIHPSKIYGAMAVARPILYFGPRPSHITDLLDADAFGVAVTHGDVDGAIAAIRGFLDSDPARLRAMGIRAHSRLRVEFGQKLLCGRLCDRLEMAFRWHP